ncbi:MAG: HTTM domain-containing protein [Chloroflexota bacterium]|nr:HTTM domain-containing protein [Chloroflexota bacterium]
MTAPTRLFTATERPEAASVARGVIGVAAMLKALERAPILERLSDPAVVRVPYFAGQPSLADVPSVLVILLWVVLAGAFAIGFSARVTGAALTLLLLAVLFSDQQLYSNHLYLLIWVVGLLTLASPGTPRSADGRVGGARGAIPSWPIWLLRLQLSVLYLFAGLSKVTGEYLSGAVVSLSLREGGFLAVPAEWRTFEVMVAAAVLSIIAEIGLAAALWLPHWRRTAFVVGFALHFGIAAWFDPTLPLLIFAIIALTPYLLFLDLEPRPLTVVFDDSCGFCTRWITWFRRLDWLRVVVVVPSSDVVALKRLNVPRADADRALQVIANDEREQGFDAVVRVLERMPVSFLWAPLARLWPVRQVGRRIYARVAGRRRCSIVPGHAGPAS